MAQEPIRGLLEAFSEAGTEGIIWSVYDDKICDIRRKRVYDALYTLKNGDLLQVFDDAARSRPLWEGTIDLDRQLARTLPQFQRGWPPHGMQRNIDPDLWIRMFRLESPCIVYPKADVMSVSSTLTA